MSSTAVYAAAAMFAAVLLGPGAAAQVSPTAVLENEFVTVARVQLRAGETATHVHPLDFVIAGLQCALPEHEPALYATIEGRIRGEQSGEMEVLLLRRGQHRLENGCAGETLLVEVEVQALVEAPAGGVAGTKLSSGGSGTSRVHRGGLIIEENRLQPHTATPEHEHFRPHLALALTDLDLRSETPGQEPRLTFAKSGDVQWVPAGVKHRLVNVGEKPARWISLEFK